MTDTKKFTAKGIRQIKAFESVNDFGASYLNPLIGKTPAETCKKVEALMPFIMEKVDEGFEECPVMSYLVHSIWSAVQYEGFLNDGPAEEVAA